MLRTSDKYGVIRKHLVFCSLAMLAGLFIFSGAAHAESSQTVKSKVTIDIDTTLIVSMPNSFGFYTRTDSILHSSTFNFQVATNHITGYTAYASVANTDFVKSDSPTEIIPTLPRVASNYTDDFPVNTWGLSFPDEDPDHFLPAGTNMLVTTYDGPTTWRTISMLIGTRLDNQTKAGTYNCVIDFQVVPNVVPDTIRTIQFLQEMNNDVAASMQEDVSYQLRDNRDGKSYWIIKKNGQIYMEQNLDLELENRIEEGVPIYTVIDEENSNVSTETTLVTTEPWGSTAGELYYHSGDGVYYPDGYKTPQDIDELDADSRDRIYAAGSYYSWDSATAGSGASVVAPATLAEESLCPYGWRLPTNSELTDFPVDDANHVRSGYYDATTGNILDIYDGHFDNTGVLYLWSANTGSTANTAKVAKVAYDGTITFSDDPVTSGYSIRCIANATNHFTLTFDANGGTGAPTNYDSINWESTIDYELSSNNPTYTGKEFMGWATTNDASMPLYMEDDTISLYPDTPVTLYAVWHEPCNAAATIISAAVCLQDVNNDVKASMVTGTQYQLRDHRDDKIYWIAKLADGNVWMTQNLDFELAENTKLYAATSDVTETREFEVDNNSDIRFTKGAAVYYLDGTTASDTIVNPSDTHYADGSLYSWKAAAANVDPVVDVATETICPKGWTLPSNSNFEDVLDSYLITDGQHYNVTNNASIAENNDLFYLDTNLDIAALRAAPLYITQAGYGTDYGRTILQGKAGRFWSGVESQSDSAYAFGVYDADAEALLQIFNNENKNSQYSVRCVLK